MRVAFLGLGIMGHAMATNLAKAGHEVTVWNRTPGKLVEGAGIAPTPAAAAQGAEVVWMCVSDTAAVEQVLFGADGIDQSLAEGMIIADSSTISPSATVKSSLKPASVNTCFRNLSIRGPSSATVNFLWGNVRSYFFFFGTGFTSTTLGAGFGVPRFKNHC